MSKEISKDVETREPVKTRTEATREQALKKEQNGSQESKYPINELAANAKKVFGTRKECVVAALRAAGVSECTVAEARAVVKKFLAKEVE